MFVSNSLILHLSTTKHYKISFLNGPMFHLFIRPEYFKILKRVNSQRNKYFTIIWVKKLFLKICSILKAPIHDATLLHANVACNKVASCMLKFHATKVACNIFACNNVASCMGALRIEQIFKNNFFMLHATCCMEIEHVLFSCNILHQNCINYYDNDNDNHYQIYDQAIKIDNRKSACFS